MYDADSLTRSKAIFDDTATAEPAPDTWGQIQAQSAPQPEQEKPGGSGLMKIASLVASFYTGGLAGGAMAVGSGMLNDKAKKTVGDAQTAYGTAYKAFGS